MRLCILTAKGIPVKRDVVLEVVRRAKERGGLTEENLAAAFAEFEAELEAYAASLIEAPEWGEVKLEKAT